MDYTIKHVTNEGDLNRVLDFAEGIFGKLDTIENRSKWLERMNTHPELLIYAESEAIIGVTPSFLEDNGNVTVGIVAVDEHFRKCGIARALMLTVEKRALQLGAHLIALGSVESAEGFYQKLGYTGQLLIQSEKHSIDELTKLNPGYPVVFTNVYERKVNQLCLKLVTPDRELQRLYESTLDGCYTQTVFWKKI